MARRARPDTGNVGTYFDGIGVERCRGCLQEVQGCYCQRPYWCTWCWEVDGSKFLARDPRCCAACLKRGRTARHGAIGPPPEGGA